MSLEARSDDSEAERAGEYIERIPYNAGIEELQARRPWAAVYYFEKLVARNAFDAEAAALLELAQAHESGADLGHGYASRVDVLIDRREGCPRS